MFDGKLIQRKLKRQERRLNGSKNINRSQYSTQIPQKQENLKTQKSGSSFSPTYKKNGQKQA